MIIESVMNFLKAMLFGVFGLINIPAVDDLSSIENIFSMMFANSRALVNFFLPWNIVRVGFPILIIILTFEDIVKFVMWILRKIPFLGIE